MAAASVPVVSERFTISTHPVIQISLESLKACKTREAALEAICNLSNALITIENLPPISASRVRFIGSHITSSLEKAVSELACLKPDKVESYKILSIAIEMLNLMNALQVETFLIGAIAPFITSYAKLITSAADPSIWELLPYMFTQVHVDVERGLLVMDAATITCYFASIDFSKSEVLVDSLILSFLSNGYMEGSSFIFPLDKKIKPDDLNLLLLSPEIKEHPSALRIVLLLCVCYFETNSVLPIKEFCFQLLTSFNTPATDGTGRYILNEYLAKKGLVPLLSYLIDMRQRCLDSGGDFNKAFFSLTTIREFSELFGVDWLQEAAETYMLAYQVYFDVKKHLLGTDLSRRLSKITEQGSDPIIIDCAKTALAGIGSRLRPYPISKASPFCTNLESFKLIPFFRLMESRPLPDGKAKPGTAKDDDEYVSVVVATKAKKVRPPSRKGDHGADMALATPSPIVYAESGGAAGGAGAGAGAEPSLMVCTDFRKAAGGAGAVAMPEHSMKSSSIDLTNSIVRKHSPESIRASLDNAKSILAALHFHPRVVSWFRSSAEGLHYYGFNDSRKPQALTVNEMTLRHRFPPQLLLLAFNPMYAKHSLSANSEGIYNHLWKSIVLINGNKYILEASIDKSNCVYHLYAKPVRNFTDYLGIQVDASAEVPSSRTGTEGTASGEMRIEVEEGPLSFNEKGDATITFDGRSITVMAL